MTDPDLNALKQALSELRDVSKEKRRTAVMKLGMMGGDTALLTLIGLVRNHHEDLIVRGRAALMLGKLGDRRAVDPLIDALYAPGYQTRVHAAQSLGKLGDPRAIPSLVRVLETETDTFRAAAEEALQKLGYKSDEDDEAPQPMMQGETE